MIMNSHNCNIKEARLEDYDEYYNLRSEKKNLYWTGYDQKPDYEKFLLWYRERLKDNNRKLYLLFVDEKCAGSLNIDYYEKYAAIGYAIKESFEGNGYGTSIVKKAIEIIKNEKQEVSEIKAWINNKNKGSIKVAEKNGFYLFKSDEVRKWFGEDEIYYEYKLDI